MVSKKGGLKRAERRQPEPIRLPVKDEDSKKPAFNPHVHDHKSSSSAAMTSSKSARKRGQSSKSLARSKLEKGVEKADRLRAKASKRMIQVEKKKRLKESS